MPVIRSVVIPVLETERTILRPLNLEHFGDYARLWADPVVTQFIIGRSLTREESWQRFLRQAGVWLVFGYGLWAVFDRMTGELIGEAGFHDLKRALEPSIEGTPEAAWLLAPQTHGKGIASEVVGSMLTWADTELAAARSVAIIDPRNTASLRVAEKCGFQQIALTTYRDAPTVLLERLRP